MAGNTATLGPYNWLVDQIAGPIMSALTLGQVVYAPGMGGLFNFFGSDDLEAMSVQASMVYPTDIGQDAAVDLLTLNYAPQATDPLAANQRWDFDFTKMALNPLSPTVSALHSGLDVGIIGRIDFTDAAGMLPVAFNTFDGPDADLTAGDDDFLPIAVNGWIVEDAGRNPPSAMVTTPFVQADIGGWSATVAEQWSTADIVSFTLFGADLDLTPTDDTQLIAQHQASNSITAPYFDGVALVARNSATATLTVCAVNTTPVFQDQGFFRYYQYMFSNMSLLTGTDICQAPVAAQDWYHAAALKLDAFGRPALLVTDPAVSIAF
jgi:hypothetical protein